MSQDKMRYWWKVQIYEIQIVLYWMLGIIILHLGEKEWVGWLAIGYGWITFLYTIGFVIKNADHLKDLFE